MRRKFAEQSAKDVPKLDKDEAKSSMSRSQVFFRGFLFGIAAFLIFLLSDRDPNVTKEAWRAIEKITGKKVNFNPNDDEQTRQQKIEKIKSWWKEERFTRLKHEVNGSLKQ